MTKKVIPLDGDPVTREQARQRAIDFESSVSSFNPQGVPMITATLHWSSQQGPSTSYTMAALTRIPITHFTSFICQWLSISRQKFIAKTYIYICMYTSEHYIAGDTFYIFQRVDYFLKYSTCGLTWLSIPIFLRHDLITRVGLQNILERVSEKSLITKYWSWVISLILFKRKILL